MYQPFSMNILTTVVIIILVLWTIPWKIYAVWTAAKNGHKKWFVVLLLLNTFTILEIIYIFKITKKSWTEVKADFRNALKAISN